MRALWAGDNLVQTSCSRSCRAVPAPSLAISLAASATTAACRKFRPISLRRKWMKSLLEKSRKRLFRRNRTGRTSRTSLTSPINLSQAPSRMAHHGGVCSASRTFGGRKACVGGILRGKRGALRHRHRPSPRRKGTVPRVGRNYGNPRQ